MPSAHFEDPDEEMPLPTPPNEELEFKKVKSSLIEGAKWKMVCIRRRSDWQYDSRKCCGECRVCSEPVKNSVISNGGVAENDNSHTRRGGCVSA